MRSRVERGRKEPYAQAFARRSEHRCSVNLMRRSPPWDGLAAMVRAMARDAARGAAPGAALDSVAARSSGAWGVGLDLDRDSVLALALAVHACLVAAT